MAEGSGVVVGVQCSEASVSWRSWRKVSVSVQLEGVTVAVGVGVVGVGVGVSVGVGEGVGVGGGVGVGVVVSELVAAKVLLVGVGLALGRH